MANNQERTISKEKTGLLKKLVSEWSILEKEAVTKKKNHNTVINTHIYRGVFHIFCSFAKVYKFRLTNTLWHN